MGRERQGDGPVTGMTAGAGRVPPELFALFCDDAAIFPPGEMPLAEAVPAHLGHVAAAHAPLVGPLVVPQARLAELAELPIAYDTGSVELAVTVPSPEDAAHARASVGTLRAARRPTNRPCARFDQNHINLIKTAKFRSKPGEMLSKRCEKRLLFVDGRNARHRRSTFSRYRQDKIDDIRHHPPDHR